MFSHLRGTLRNFGSCHPSCSMLRRYDDVFSGNAEGAAVKARLEATVAAMATIPGGKWTPSACTSELAATDAAFEELFRCSRELGPTEPLRLEIEVIELQPSSYL